MYKILIAEILRLSGFQVHQNRELNKVAVYE
jgi:hypothetical protein